MTFPRLETTTSLYAKSLIKSSRWPPQGFSTTQSPPRKANLPSWRTALELGSLLDALINLDTSPTDGDEEVIRRAVLRVWIRALSSKATALGWDEGSRAAQGLNCLRCEVEGLRCSLAGAAEKRARLAVRCRQCERGGCVWCVLRVDDEGEDPEGLVPGLGLGRDKWGDDEKEGEPELDAPPVSYACLGTDFWVYVRLPGLESELVRTRAVEILEKAGEAKFGAFGEFTGLERRALALPEWRTTPDLKGLDDYRGHSCERCVAFGSGCDEGELMRERYFHVSPLKANYRELCCMRNRYPEEMYAFGDGYNMGLLEGDPVKNRLNKQLAEASLSPVGGGALSDEERRQRHAIYLALGRWLFRRQDVLGLGPLPVIEKTSPNDDEAAIPSSPPDSET